MNCSPLTCHPRKRIHHPDPGLSMPPLLHRRSISGSVHVIHLEHARCLARGKLGVATDTENPQISLCPTQRDTLVQDQIMDLPAIVRVIHIVMDAVQPSITGTTVLVGGTSRGSGTLERCIVDGVSITGARLALEDVKETEPVADLMGC